MSQILENVRKVDPNDSDAVKEIVTVFFQNLMKHTEVNCSSWLRVLEYVITRYPRYCAQHRGSVEQYLVHFVDCTSPHNLVEAARCAHALQQIRPSQDKMATAKNCWREQMGVLCDAAHALVEAAFPHAADAYRGGARLKAAPGGVLAGSALAAALRRATDLRSAKERTTRLSNVLVFMQAMLVEAYPVAKPVRPQAVLEAAVRALAAQTEGAVKVQALRTVDALVRCLGSNVIPFSSLVFRCAMQTLRWSADTPGEHSRDVRRCAYESLCAWLCALGPVAPPSLAEELTTHLVRDITPTPLQTTLTTGELTGGRRRGGGKRARRREAQLALQRSALARHAPDATRHNATCGPRGDHEETSRAALRCAEALLCALGALLPPATHQLLQDVLVRECYRASVARHSAPRLVLLLRALHATRTAPRAAPSPAHHLLHLYATLGHHHCHEVRWWCARAAHEVRLQLHAAPPSLHYAPAAPPAPRARNLSKKNRAALQTLLGKQRLNLSSDEVITISDEPSNKRARLDSREMVSDKISVSSDSVESINNDEDSDDATVHVESDRERESQDTSQVKSSADASNVEMEDEINAGNEIDTIDIANNTNQPHAPQPDTPTFPTNIYEAKTQAPLNTSTDQDTAEDDERFVSIEVVYDHNLEKKVTILERTEDDNLPSSNDVDDVQITCGQVIQCSQELDTEKNKSSEEIPKVHEMNSSTIETLKVNGNNETAEVMPEINGINNCIDRLEVNDDAADDGDSGAVIERVDVKITAKEITVDDMLADFVDEPIDNARTEA